MPCHFISSCLFLDTSSWAKRQDPEFSKNEPAGPAGVVVEQPADQPAIPVGEDPAAAVAVIEGIVDQQPPPAAVNGGVATAAAANGMVAIEKAAKARAAKTFRAYLPSQCHRTYSCVHCRAHLANHDELISKSFQGSQGRAYLFNSVVNIGCGQAEERVLLTGLHAVADIYCDCCKTTLGWKYEQAYESSQKYKEGKFIIELAHMIKENGWENES